MGRHKTRRLPVRRPGLYELHVQFIRFVENTCSIQTARLYDAILSKFFDKYTYYFNLGKFTLWNAEDWKILLSRDGLKPSTITYQTSVLRSFWEWMCEQGHIDNNPFDGKLTGRTPRRLSIEDMRLLVWAAYAPKDKLLLLLSLTTFLRRVDLIKLCWKDVNFEQGCINLEGRIFHLRPDVYQLMIELRGSSESKVFDKWNSVHSLDLRFKKIANRTGLPKPLSLATLRRSTIAIVKRDGALAI